MSDAYGNGLRRSSVQIAARALRRIAGAVLIDGLLPVSLVFFVAVLTTALLSQRVNIDAKSDSLRLSRQRTADRSPTAMEVRLERSDLQSCAALPQTDACGLLRMLGKASVSR